MFAGVLTEKIEIYDFVTSKSDIGVISETRNLIYTTRAKVGHVSGSRTVINNEITIPYTKNFVIRYYVPITDTCWIKYNDKFYRVMSIDKDPEMQQQIIIGELVEE
jgi:SPP1 family predicted phage head-tail adaptor